MSYITQTIDEFFVKLDKMQNDLTKFSQTLDNRSDKIPILLKNFKTAVLQSTNNENNPNSNAVEREIQKSLENFRNIIETWNEEIEKDRKGKQFIKKNEKYLVVMVFGAVKAGKSSLGNFFAGKNFFNAPFDNHYKEIPKPIFETEEKGRDTGDIEKDSKGDTWFQEGIIDTTGAIQYFTLSGLRWIDSPGTGAVGKAGDTKDMTKLVEEYLKYTDMCIFLMNSSEPGLQDDMKYMMQLDKDDQESLIVITKSDEYDEDEDDEGEPIGILVPKPPEKRKLQEDDICKRVVEEREKRILLENYRKNHSEIENDLKKCKEKYEKEYKEKYKKEPPEIDLIKELEKILREKLKKEFSEKSSLDREKIFKERLKREISNGLQEELKKELQRFRTKFRTISISTALANEAIQKEDDEKFKASNLDKLIKILGDKISDNAIARKQENPRKLLNGFVDNIIDKLQDFEKDIDNIISAAENYKSEMGRKSALIISNVRRELRSEVAYKAHEWNRKVKSGQKIDNSSISIEISSILKEKLNDEINSQMQLIIEDFQNTEMKTVRANISAAALEKKTAQIEHTYTKAHTVTREPEGIIENVRSFFGKKYYRTEYSTEKEYQTVDLGTNLDEFLDSLMPQVEKYAKSQADENLVNLRDNYFVKQENFAKNRRNEINKLRKELLALKF